MDALQNSPYVAILRGISPTEVEAVAAVLLDAGFKALEVPLTSPESLESISRLKYRYGGSLTVGAGTVLNASQVKAVHNAGGTFIVSPNVEQTVIAATKELEMTAIPGCFSPSECFKALEYGADILKIFPVSTLGLSFVQALKSVLPEGTKLLPTGGIRPDTALQYLNVPVAGVGLGDALYTVNRPLHTIRERANAFMAKLDNDHE